MFGDKVYHTAEAAFQAVKFASPEHKAIIRSCQTGGDALREARNLQSFVRHDWFDINIKVMNTIVGVKAMQHPEIRQSLLDTGAANLVEDSPVDWFWGCGRDRTGKNHLGKAWMRERDRLQAELGLLPAGYDNLLAELR